MFRNLFYGRLNFFVPLTAMQTKISKGRQILCGGRYQKSRWSQKTRGLPLSYDVHILTDYSFILSQCTHLTDGRTDRQTESP